MDNSEMNSRRGKITEAQDWLGELSDRALIWDEDLAAARRDLQKIDALLAAAEGIPIDNRSHI